MADQVVLLRGGKIEQIGSPADLYETPATTFAASFLGMPPMNVVPLDRIKGAKTPGGSPGNKSPGWLLGIRPEDIKITKSGIPVEVTASDYMGAETVLRVKHGDEVLMARINGRTSALPGDQLKITWSGKDAHLFDEKGIRRESSKAAPS